MEKNKEFQMDQKSSIDFYEDIPIDENTGSIDSLTEMVPTIKEKIGPLADRAVSRKGSRIDSSNQY